MADITVDRQRISNHIKATVNVTNDTPFTKIEVRATHNGSDFGKGTGTCLLSDDSSAVNGIVSLPIAVNSYSFDVESAELLTDGEYRISVFLYTQNGKWTDGSALLAVSSDDVFDKNGARIFVGRNGSGTDITYKSAYTGDDINNFISEVLL